MDAQDVLKRQMLVCSVDLVDARVRVLKVKLFLTRTQLFVLGADPQSRDELPLQPFRNRYIVQLSRWCIQFSLIAILCKVIFGVTFLIRVYVVSSLSELIQGFLFWLSF